jgi:hypothetical protein
VLAQGAKGLNEMKTAADACYAMSEPGKHSPMYGMIDFRRRKVLLKLVVDGTSRLIQGALGMTPLGSYLFRLTQLLPQPGCRCTGRM